MFFSNKCSFSVSVTSKQMNWIPNQAVLGLTVASLCQCSMYSLRRWRALLKFSKSLVLAKSLQASLRATVPPSCPWYCFATKQRSCPVRGAELTQAPGISQTPWCLPPRASRRHSATGVRLDPMYECSPYPAGFCTHSRCWCLYQVTP